MNFTEIAFSKAVKDLQLENGSRKAYERFENQDRGTKLDISEITFILQRDSFYMATINASGDPYLQFRGGPKGF